MPNLKAFLFTLILSACFVVSVCTAAHSGARSGQASKEMIERSIGFPEGSTRNVRILHSVRAGLAESTLGITAYVTVRDKTTQSSRLRERIMHELRTRGFTITDRPSKAERIIDLVVISRRTADSQSVEDNVQNGYGHTVTLSHGSAHVIVADLLLVWRDTASGKKPDLSTISSRRMTGSTQVRIGILDTSPTAKVSLDQFLAADVALLSSCSKFMTEKVRDNPNPRYAKDKKKDRKRQKE